MKTVYRKLFLILALVVLLVPVLSISAQDQVTLVLWHAKQDAEGDALLSIIELSKPLIRASPSKPSSTPAARCKTASSLRQVLARVPTW